MQRSSDRILTTHVGSLARPHDLLEVMREKEHGRPYEPNHFAEMITAAVRDVVRRQAEAGLDVVTDGEQGKVSFLTYVKERLAGFDQVEGRPCCRRPGSGRSTTSPGTTTPTCRSTPRRWRR